MRLFAVALMSLLVFAACDTTTTAVDQPATQEPQPPQILDLEVISGPDAEGHAVLEAVVTPPLEGRAELTLLRHPAIRFESGSEPATLSLAQGVPDQRIQIPLDISGGEPVSVQVCLTVFDESGEQSMLIVESQAFNAPPSDPAANLVPLILTLEDGTQIVERLPRAEAERRAAAGQGVIGTAEPGAAPSPREEVVRDEGGDQIPGPEVQQ